jgi:hypothetical protein
VPASRVWLHYRCEQNREHAWGYKVRAVAMRWKIRNELQLAATPFECGWELMQLLVEEAPAVIAQPYILANLLWYLLHGRAPHKEKVSLLLLRCLPSFDLAQIDFDWNLFHTLEQHIAWHDHLVRQSQQVDAALLPSSSQCTLDLLLELRERLQASRVLD